MGLKVKAHREKKSFAVYRSYNPSMVPPTVSSDFTPVVSYIDVSLWFSIPQTHPPHLILEKVPGLPINWEGPSSTLTSPLYPRALFLSPLAFINSLSLFSGSEEGMPKGMLTWADDQISPSDLLPPVISFLGGSLVLSYSSSSFL